MLGQNRQSLAAGGLGRRSGLGPQGRGILERLFGGGRESPEEQEPRREACCIAIASGKGGTGKSFLATSLAVVLGREDRRVTLVDCDFGLACDHLLLGVKPKMTMQHVISGRATLRDVRIITPAGPALIPGGSGVRQMANLSDQELLIFGEKLGELAAQEDILILDLGAGIAPQTLLTLLCSNHVLLVTQPEIAALTDAYAVIKVLAKLKKDSTCSVVVNRVVREKQGLQAFDKLYEVAQKHTGVDLQYLGEIGEDATVTQRRLGQQPLVATDPTARTSKSIEKVAERLAEIARPLAQREVKDGATLFDRFSEHRLFL